MFDEYKDIPKKIAALDSRLADAEARLEFLFDLVKGLRKDLSDGTREAEKADAKVEARLKAVEQELAKLRKK